MSCERILQVPSYYTQAQLPEFTATLHETVTQPSSHSSSTLLSVVTQAKLSRILHKTRLLKTKELKSIELKIFISNKATHCLHSTYTSGIHQHNLFSHCLERGQKITTFHKPEKTHHYRQTTVQPPSYKHSASFLNN
jgi:hypothetical protein